MMEGYVPLFETKEANDQYAYRLLSTSMFLGICMVWVYRATHIFLEEISWGTWFFMFSAELWFGFYWLITQSVRWNRIYRNTFKHQLSQRYEDKLPGVDVFVCTADPIMEPPMIVINTVLSVMAYDYPPEKLSVYLSDDGGSDITFYALLEASHFSRHWIPFCKKFNIEPRSPSAYFSTQADPLVDAQVLSSVKRLYDEMEDRITTATKLGRAPQQDCLEHKGFSEWISFSSTHDHQTILQLLIDSRDPSSIDITGCALPTLVYLSREKRPTHHHNFKGGAMNALIRVSSEISNGQIILNVDCDMYSNNSASVRDALCFFMDEQKGHEIAFVQYPQCFKNLSKNDIYAGSLRVMGKIEFPGLDGFGGPLYIGTGCFHRRETLCGRKYSEEAKLVVSHTDIAEDRVKKSISVLEETTKKLASCSFEDGTDWGKEMGVKYGCPVEDVITGLSIQCRGWKSIYFNPPREGFLGIAPITLIQTLVQHKRWSQGDLQILLSRYGPLSYGMGRLKLGLQMGYCMYCFWAVNCLATLCYSVIPQLYLLRGISLYPKISSLWCVPFAYVILAEMGYSVYEFLWCGGTFQGWWNEQRIWMFKRTTSYLFAFIDSLLTLIGIGNSAFDITAKVANKEVSQRYEKEIMEFGTASATFVILATLALINLFCLVGGVIGMVMNKGIGPGMNSLLLQILLSGAVVALNLPVYQGTFFRRDNGRMPTDVTAKSVLLALSACYLIFYLGSQ